MIDQLKKIVARIVRIFIGVEDVDDGVFADREHQAVGGLGAAELVQVGLELFSLAAQIDRLAEEPSLNQKIGIRLAYFIGFAAGISRRAKGVAEPEPLVDLRIDPDFGARPRPDTGIERYIDCFPAVGGRAEALRSPVR